VCFIPQSVETNTNILYITLHDILLYFYVTYRYIIRTFFTYYIFYCMYIIMYFYFLIQEISLHLVQHATIYDIMKKERKDYCDSMCRKELGKLGRFGDTS